MTDDGSRWTAQTVALGGDQAACEQSTESAYDAARNALASVMPEPEAQNP